MIVASEHLLEELRERLRHLRAIVAHAALEPRPTGEALAGAREIQVQVGELRGVATRAGLDAAMAEALVVVGHALGSFARLPTRDHARELARRLAVFAEATERRRQTLGTLSRRLGFGIDEVGPPSDLLIEARMRMSEANLEDAARELAAVARRLEEPAACGSGPPCRGLSIQPG